VSWQRSTARTEVLDDGRKRRYCRIILSAADRSPLHVARRGARSNRRSQATIRFPLLKPLLGCLFVRRHVRETDDENRTALRSQARRRSDSAPHVQIITLPRRYACQKSMRREMRSARPFTVNNRGIDARNGQAYHGRQTTLTNETRPASLGSRSCEGQREHRERRGRVASRVRSCSGAAGRTRVLRVGTEAAIANDSMRCKT